MRRRWTRMQSGYWQPTLEFTLQSDVDKGWWLRHTGRFAVQWARYLAAVRLEDITRVSHGLEELHFEANIDAKDEAARLHEVWSAVAAYEERASA